MAVQRKHLSVRFRKYAASRSAMPPAQRVVEMLISVVHNSHDTEAIMKWSVAKAREQFSDLLRQTAIEPQEIYNRNRLVAAVIGPDSFQELSDSMKSKTQKTLKESLAELRKVMAEEGYKLEIPPRKNRK